MHIFIDESGTFTPSKGRAGISLVASLVLPDYRLAKIEQKYARLRPRLTQENGEVKGKLQNESQVSAVVDILRRNEALLEVVATDMNLQTDAEIVAHKMGLSQGMAAGLGARYADACAQVEALTNQLYVQSWCMFELVRDTQDHAINYFAQRQPAELGAFHWTLDAKDKFGKTRWENWWTRVVLPTLHFKSVEAPVQFFDAGDYSHFARFEMDAPEWAPAPKDGKGKVTDLNKLLMENFTISPKPLPGLEMVDILANAVRRALRGDLLLDGWKGIPALMIHRKQHYVQLVALTERELPVSTLPYRRQLLGPFSKNGRSMIAPRFQRDD